MSAEVKSFMELCGFDYSVMVDENSNYSLALFCKAIEGVTSGDIPAVDICFQSHLISNGVDGWEVYDENDIYVSESKRICRKSLLDVMNFFDLSWDNFIKVSHEFWEEDVELSSCA